MRVCVRFSRAVRSAAVVSFAAALALSGAARARELPPVDRLGDVPATHIAADAAVAPVTRRDANHHHSRLRVPTFLWGRGALAAGAAAASQPTRDPVTAARAHLAALGHSYALERAHVDALPVAQTQHLANGAALVKFRNRIDGVEVFREEASVLLSPQRDLVAVGGFVTGGAAIGRFAHSAPQAAAVALADWSFAGDIATALRAAGERDGYAFFDVTPARAASADGSRLDAPLRTKPVYFRLPEGLVPAYYVEVSMRDGSARGVLDNYAYVISAVDLTLLYRHNQTADAAYAYRVFAEPADGHLPYPAPSGRNGFPHPTGVPDGYQAPFVTPNLVTLSNLPFSRNDPWLPPDATRTRGNNVDAFANLVMPEGFNPADPDECDLRVPPGAGDLHACTNAANTFDYTFDPTQPPRASRAQVMAAVTNLFYVTNWLHDWYYDAGFDELAGNAQASNYGRGGLDGDVLIAQAQDASGTNNASMTTRADGTSPRMRMFVFEHRLSEIKVLSPAPLAGIKASGVARFGSQSFDVTAAVVRAVPPEACAELANAAALAGRIALIDLGDEERCDAPTKARNAQRAGAAGVLLAEAAPPYVGTILATAADVVVPTLVIGALDARAIASQPDGTVSARLARAGGVDRDGTMANDIIAHEWGHYISNRLIADANGLSTTQASGLGEGWADFHALLLLVKATDAALPNNASFGGTYAYGAYPDGGPDLAPDVVNAAWYHGERRYPYSRDFAKNPLTFRHIQNGVPLPAAPAAFTIPGDYNAEPHNTGEVWASMLWQCYTNLLNDTTRLTFARAQDRMKRYLVAAYKMTPASPTLVEARDALLAVIGTQSREDHALCMQGFAARGAGTGAVAPDRFASDNAGVIESYGGLAVVDVAVTDRPQYCDADGLLDNGETGLVTVTLQNTGVIPLAATSGTVSADNANVRFPNGSVLTFPATVPGQTVSVSLPIALNGAMGREGVDITVAVVDAALPGAPPSVTANFAVNADRATAASATDDVESPRSPWRPDFNGLGRGRWQRIAISPSDHRWAASDPVAITDEWLVSPPLDVAATGSFSFSFVHRHSYRFIKEEAYDGGLLYLSTNGTDFSPIPAAALSPSYSGTIIADGDNPRRGMPAFVRANAGYPEREKVTVNLGTAYQGKTVYVAFVSATDRLSARGSFTGWEIDDIAFSNITNTPFDLTTPDAHACVSIAPRAGTPQSATVGTAFATPLQVLVRNGRGVALAGVPVTFSVPASGASASFAAVGAVLTDATGVATAPALTANGVAGSYSATATAGLQSTTFALTNTPAAITTPKLVRVASRKSHGARVFDLPLAAMANDPTTEPRRGQPDAVTHTLVFEFDAPLAGGTARLVAGRAVLQAPVFRGNEMIVTVTAVANARYLTIAVDDVASVAGGKGGSASVRVGFLLGDVDGDRLVTAADRQRVSEALSQPLAASNFLRDVDLDGALTAADVLLVEGELGTALRAP